MRRTTACALGGVLAGTVLLGSGTTMATFSDSETVTVVVGAAGGEPAAAGAVELSVRPAAPAGARSGAPTNALTLAVDASVTGVPASLQMTAANAPGADACGPGTRSITVSVTGDRLLALRPVQLCDLLDLDRPVVIGAVDAQAGPLAGAVVEVRFDGIDGAALPFPGWDGSLTFTLVQGASGPRATATVPARAEPVPEDEAEVAAPETAPQSSE